MLIRGRTMSDDLLLGQEEDLLAGQEEGLLLRQEEDLLLFHGNQKNSLEFHERLWNSRDFTAFHGVP